MLSKKRSNKIRTKLKLNQKRTSAGASSSVPIKFLGNLSLILTGVCDIFKIDKISNNLFSKFKN